MELDILDNLKNLTVLIAEDESLVRQGIAALIEPDVEEIIEASDGEQALSLLKTMSIDIALLDIGLPLRTGLDVMAEIRSRNIDVKIIILTGDTNAYSPTKVYAAGADAFIYKTADAQSFLDVFSSVARGTPVPKTDAKEGENAKSVAELRESLTARELQIVKLIVEGANNQQTADALFISQHTVRKHREHINRKLNIKSPTALANFAIKANLV